MSDWLEIDKMLRAIKKDNPTEFKNLEDMVDLFGMTPLVKLRNLFIGGIKPFVPLDNTPIELESGGNKLTVTAGEIATWMTATRAGALSYNIAKATLLGSSLGR